METKEKSTDSIVREMRVGEIHVFPLDKYDCLGVSVLRAKRTHAPKKVEYKRYQDFDKATCTIKRVK